MSSKVVVREKIEGRERVSQTPVNGLSDPDPSDRTSHSPLDPVSGLIKIGDAPSCGVTGGQCHPEVRIRCNKESVGPHTNLIIGSYDTS